MNLNHLLTLLGTTELGYRLGRASLVLVSVLTLLMFGNLLLVWWSDLRLAVFSQPSSLTQAKDEVFSLIPAAHLFGFNPPDSLETIPVTSAALRLTGIIQITNGGSASKALIASEGGLGKVYQEGDVLPGGIKVVTVGAENVILENAGQLERLPLQRPRLERR